MKAETAPTNVRTNEENEVSASDTVSFEDGCMQTRGEHSENNGRIKMGDKALAGCTYEF